MLVMRLTGNINMLTTNQLKRLRANWGEKADAMECNAEVKVYDPQSKWECYLLAINPDDDDELICIVKGFGKEITTWSMSGLALLYNDQGEGVQIDHEFRPRKASEVFKNINAELL